MRKKKALIFGTGGAAAVAAIAAAAFALAPGHRGLAALDLDGDGRIVNAEIQRSARQRFAELDRNSDGRLTGEELPRGRHGREHRRHHRDGPLHDGFAPDPAQPPAPVAPAVDPANAAAAAPPALPAPPRRGLAAADADGDGAINLREYYVQLSSRAARADADRDGAISAEELAAHRDRGPRHRR